MEFFKHWQFDIITLTIGMLNLFMETFCRVWFWNVLAVMYSQNLTCGLHYWQCSFHLQSSHHFNGSHQADWFWPFKDWSDESHHQFIWRAHWKRCKRISWQAGKNICLILETLLSAIIAGFFHGLFVAKRAVGASDDGGGIYDSGV